MKCPGLSPVLLAATLFIAPAAPGADAPPPAMSSRAADLLKRFDKNGDGKLDETELADAREAMLQEQMQKQASRAALPGGEAMRAKMLEMFDKNRDGRLDDEERAAMRRYDEETGLGENGEVRDELLKRFDKNADGKLDETERAELVKFLQERRARLTMEPAGAPVEQAKLDAIAAEVAKRKAERAKRAQEAATPKP